MPPRRRGRTAARPPWGSLQLDGGTRGRLSPCRRPRPPEPRRHARRRRRCPRRAWRPSSGAWSRSWCSRASRPQRSHRSGTHRAQPEQDRAPAPVRSLPRPESAPAPEASGRERPGRTSARPGTGTPGTAGTGGSSTLAVTAGVVAGVPLDEGRGRTTGAAAALAFEARGAAGSVCFTAGAGEEADAVAASAVAATFVTDAAATVTGAAAALTGAATASTVATAADGAPDDGDAPRAEAGSVKRDMSSAPPPRTMARPRRPLRSSR